MLFLMVDFFSGFEKMNNQMIQLITRWDIYFVIICQWYVHTYVIFKLTLQSRGQVHAVSQRHTQIDLSRDILDEPELLTCLFNLQSNLLCLVQCVC